MSKKFVCTVCGYVHEGDAAPAKCPKCNAPQSKFKEMKKELKGTNCYCINYVEKWEDGQQHYEEIEIVCQKLENGPVSYDNPWK